MTKKKTTKRALLMSALSLMMCVTMFVGSTFAWFTDEVTSGNNKIVAGNLDIELEYYNGSGWKTVNGATNLFSKELWEPGHTEVVYLKLSNLGSLALKYQLGINVVSEKGGTNVADKAFKLSEHIYMGVVENVEPTYSSREAAIEAAKSGANGIIGNGYTKSGSMNADADELYMAVVVYMPETVGNEANYKSGTDAPEINLGINLIATQLTKEIDSFGPDYDEDAGIYSAVVTSEAELVAALAEAKNGDIIGISGNVTWTTGAGIGSTPFVTDATYITLKGVDENATFTAIGSGVGAVGIDNGIVIFKNLKIADESVSYAENSWEYGYLEFRGNTVFENCDVVNAIMMEGISAKFVDSSFNSNDDNQYAVWVSDGVATFANCYFTGARGIKIHEAYGSEVGTVVIDDNTFVDLSKKPGLAIGDLNEDSVVALTNNEFIGTQPGDQNMYSYESDTDVSTFTFTYSGNKITGKDDTLPDGLYKVEEGMYYATNSNGLNQGVKSLNVGDTIVVYNDIDFGKTQLSIEKDITVDFNGHEFSTENARPVRLTNGASIKNGTINVITTVAAVVVHGNEKVKSIENLTINVTTPAGKTTTGIQLYNDKHVDTIKDVTITGVTQGIEVANGSSVGLIENVKVEAAKSALQVQQSTIGEIKNSSFHGDVYGVWSQLKGTNDLVLKFSDCEISGDSYGLYVCDEGATIVPDGIAYLTYDEKTTFTGGIKDREFVFGQSGKLVVNGAKIGALVSNADELFDFAKKVNEENNSFNGLTVMLTADIDLENKVWTPIGQTGATEFRGTFDGQNYTISNLNIDSSAQTGGHYSSGLFGWAESGVSIMNVKIEGATVVGNHNVAVLVGYTYSAKISNCHVINADITCKHANGDACGDKAGLIVGYAGDESRINACSASNSTVTAGRDAGQLIGCGYNVSISDCTATNVTVSSTGECTGANVNEAVIGRVM